MNWKVKTLISQLIVLIVFFIMLDIFIDDLQSLPVLPTLGLCVFISSVATGIAVALWKLWVTKSKDY